MMNRTIIPEMITTDGFVVTDLNNESKKNKKGRVKQITENVADKITEYKMKAIQILKSAEALDKLLEKVEDKLVTLGPKGKKFAYIPEMIMLIRSYIIKEYTDITFAGLVLITTSLLYFLSPIDVIPDFIPGAGLLDDMLVANTIIKWCDQDIEKYMEWRKNK